MGLHRATPCLSNLWRPCAAAGLAAVLALAPVPGGAGPAQATTWFTDAAQPGDTGDGLSWATAKQTIGGGHRRLGGRRHRPGQVRPLPGRGGAGHQQRPLPRLGRRHAHELGRGAAGFEPVHRVRRRHLPRHDHHRRCGQRGHDPARLHADGRRCHQRRRSQLWLRGWAGHQRRRRSHRRALPHDRQPGGPYLQWQRRWRQRARRRHGGRDSPLPDRQQHRVQRLVCVRRRRVRRQQRVCRDP